MKIKVSALLGALLVFLLIGLAFAKNSYMTSFNTRYGTTATVLNTCNLCHPGGDTTSFTTYGTDFLNAGANTAAFVAIENLDSDSDGFTNIVEINARTFPGDPSSFPVLADTTLPVVTGFSIPATATALTVPILVFTATDNVAVTGYLVNEVSAKPAAGVAGWAATPPASYLFATAGAKTLYGWAKDSAGNVSNGASGSVTITLPDTTLPVVTGFSIPAAATALTVPISVFTATDNVAVTGYLVNEVSAKPAAGVAGWAATPPASYLFATAGAKMLYGWAKDAAGNVSNSASGSVTITLADTTLPVVTGFSIPTTATTLTVPISVFTATDNVAVTGYLVNEVSAKPTAGAAGWAATPPASYLFATAGAKTLYAWAKDTAGNVSNSASGSVTITLPDATAPTVTTFAIPATSTSLTVAIVAFTATDAVGVVGYLATESATATAALAADWTVSAPTAYTFATAGSKTLYGWAKDAAGNVSNSASGSVTITLPDATAPTVTAFTIPAAATSLTVAITTFTATDTVGVAGYLVTESATAPAASAGDWTVSATTAYTFATAGSKTLYAWAKDAAGNVSNSASGSVTITLPDATAPTVTTFTIPAASTSLTVAITALTATDTVGVAGYLVTESATAPAASASGWTVSAPAAYIFATEGSKTLYAWAKDAAGNVSSALSATVAITLVNNIPGTIQGSVSVNFAGHSNLGVANATVSLAGTNYTTATDADGKFMLTNIPPGSYQIVVASPDVAATAQQITLVAGANLQINILTVAPTRGDANGDNKLGLEDVLYILQVLSKMR